MITSIQLNGQALRFDPSKPIDISIPLNFNGPQPNAYGVEPATASPCKAGDLVGDTRRGGSCNFEEYKFIAHCNGTHTECVGHITNERISVRDSLREVFIAATLVTVAPSYAKDTDESYSVAIDPADRLITRRELESSDAATYVDALIIRTLPNDDRKLTRNYTDNMPPYFTSDAMNFIVDLGFKHLLVDLPSIDRLYDEGKLSNHRIFWNVGEDSFERNSNTRKNSTITEMIYTPNAIEDGLYLLNLQIAPFASDASPSRPVLFYAQ